ncbi:glycosyltransferase family 2 protein [uncultured Brachyspira sp.]|uniref:glycosyltransferase family 2 protein n=1 Tax=uncultured Brachyspira sp. TaxID=221953 RepID=UPI00260B6019|nr:glycosyltransferase family 2 protein [uncultured Brachyspira sp.]
MIKKILEFIFSKKDKGIYCYITILGIKIVTKPLRLKILEMDKRIENSFNTLRKEILISRGLNYQVPIYSLNENEIKYSPLVSVIITVYNIGSKYLVHCLESVINQTLKDIEIIIVNDASHLKEDDDICLSYKEKDSRITYIKLDKNVGDGEARMCGLRKAKGYAVSFVDGDDYLSPNLYEITVGNMLQNSLDIVCYNFFILHKNNNNIVFLNSANNNMPYNIFYKKDSIDIFSNTYLYIDGHLWNKLFRREILLKVGYNNMAARYKCKDLNYCFKVFIEAEAISYIPINLYFYIDSRQTSIINNTNFKDNFFTDIYYIYTDMYDYINKSSNEMITKLFASNFDWLYNSALKFDRYKIKDEKYFINLFGKIILDLKNYGAINIEQLIENVKINNNNNINMINWLDNLFLISRKKIK